MALSSFNVKKMTLIGSAFAAYSGGLLMNKRKRGKDDFDHQKRLMTMLSLIYSIKEYGTIYVNPNLKMGITSLNSGATIRMYFFVSDSLTVVLDEFTFTTSIVSVARQQLIDFINVQNKGFSASLDGTAANPIKISAVNGHLSNGIPITVNTTGTISLSFDSVTFSNDGSDFFSRYPDRILENNEVESILDKIDSYIDVPYSKFVSF